MLQNKTEFYTKVKVYKIWFLKDSKVRKHKSKNENKIETKRARKMSSQEVIYQTASKLHCVVEMVLK